MTRTQIRLPDDLYERSREVCTGRAISLSELTRRGLECILSVYAKESGADREWQPPKPRSLGWTRLSDAEIKEQAQLTTAEEAFTHRRSI